MRMKSSIVLLLAIAGFSSVGAQHRTPHRRIARLELIVGGEEKQSATTPRFGVRVSRVATR
jgi:hypothetical protein